MRYFFLLLLILFAGCSSLPVRQSILDKKEKEVAQLKIEKSDLEKQKADIFRFKGGETARNIRF